jgi:hypothetical protein
MPKIRPKTPRRARAKGAPMTRVARGSNKRAMRKAGGIEMAAYLKRKRKPGEVKLAVMDGPMGSMKLDRRDRKEKQHGSKS